MLGTESKSFKVKTLLENDTYVKVVNHNNLRFQVNPIESKLNNDWKGDKCGYSCKKHYDGAHDNKAQGYYV